MMIEFNFELFTNIRELRRIDAPCPPSNLNGALKRQGWRGYSIGRATRLKDPSVKGSVVRHQKFGPMNKRFDFWPNFSKIVFLGHVLPSQPVNVSENKLSRWRLYQIHFLIDNGSANNFHQAKGACAVGLIVRRFEVYRYEIHCRYHRRGDIFFFVDLSRILASQFSAD